MCMMTFSHLARGLEVLQSHLLLRIIFDDSSKAGTESEIDTNVLVDIEADIVAGAKAEGDEEAEEDTESSTGDTIKIGVDVVSEPVAPDDLPGLTVAERLEEYEETMV
ncbi:hypothetical protein Tco_1211797, partial [Tanacetum coccineum]